MSANLVRLLSGMLGSLLTATMAGAATSDAPPKSAPPPKAVETTPPVLETELKVARELLATMRTRYKDGHPDVKTQLRKIADLEQQLAKMKAPHPAPEPTTSRAHD